MLVVTVSITCALGGCSSLAPPPQTLYERLGGARGVDELATRLVNGFAHSPYGRRAFDRVRLPRVIRQLGSFLCVLADGPCVHTGDDMRVVHAGHRITEREFNALVEHLRRTLDDMGIDAAAKNELLRRLAPMRRDIVTAGTVSAPVSG